MPSEKQAYKLARSLLKDFALERIAEEATRQNLSPSMRQKVQAKTLTEIKKLTENFSTHWVRFSAKGLVRVTDLEAYVKRKLMRFRVSRYSPIGRTRIPPKPREHPKKSRQPIFASLHEFVIASSCSITCPSTSLIDFALK